MREQFKAFTTPKVFAHLWPKPVRIDEYGVQIHTLWRAD